MLISYRAIDCAEYDEAARRKPHLCPLVHAGDWRSGHQLIRDVAADSEMGMEVLASSPGGRAKLEMLAASVEVWAGCAELRLGEAAASWQRAGPCGRGAT